MKIKIKNVCYTENLKGWFRPKKKEKTTRIKARDKL